MAYDSIVIGAGYAGLMAAYALMRGGHKVLLLAKGYGRTHLATGAVDVLGYMDGKSVGRPMEAVARLPATQAGHPYARLSAESLRSGAALFLEAMAEGSYPFAGSIDENMLLPTAAGVARPVALVPQTMLAGDLRQGGSFVFVGFDHFKDFYPDLIAANLQSSNLNTRAISLTAPDFEGEADTSAMALARAFDKPAFRQQLAEQLKPKLKSGERVGFPAVLGVAHAAEVLDDLQTRLGAPVFEIPTLPPSIPGIRIATIIQTLLRRGGARVQIGHPVVAVNVNGNRVESVAVKSAARLIHYRAPHFVLATGGIAARGLEVDSHGAVAEPLFDLPVANIPAAGQPRFDPAYFAEHPFNKIGIMTDAGLRPLDAHGRPVFDNLRVCGALLAGAEPWKEKSGEGISLASAYQSAQSILDEGRKTIDESKP